MPPQTIQGMVRYLNGFVLGGGEGGGEVGGDRRVGGL